MNITSLRAMNPRLYYSRSHKSTLMMTISDLVELNFDEINHDDYHNRHTVTTFGGILMRVATRTYLPIVTCFMCGIHSRLVFYICIPSYNIMTNSRIANWSTKTEIGICHECDQIFAILEDILREKSALQSLYVSRGLSCEAALDVYNYVKLTDLLAKTPIFSRDNIIRLLMIKHLFAAHNLNDLWRDFFMTYLGAN